MRPADVLDQVLAELLVLSNSRLAITAHGAQDGLGWYMSAHMLDSESNMNSNMG